jgi:hypothetical protein
MKIYIQENKLPFLANSNKKKLENLEKYLISEESIIDIYSKQGMYQINDNKTYKLYTKSEKVHKNIIIQNDINEKKEVILVVDDSEIIKETVYGIPCDHINIPLIIKKYSLNKNNKSSILLVIEFVKKDTLIPINYFFEYNKKYEANNNIPTEDISVFLSLLNKYNNSIC